MKKNSCILKNCFNEKKIPVGAFLEPLISVFYFFTKKMTHPYLKKVYYRANPPLAGNHN